ncbi:MAG: gas vesicle protein GvpJ [Jatrophihabitans sp.]|uniref:gas vesicle protein GvpJ n=1 Tax=Jatrophihabitans sp. TaxID=1932789 RepID=UPI003F7FC027
MEPTPISSIGRGAGAPGVRRPDGGSGLADVLERVLDKGVVIVGDVGVNILDIELLTLKIRLLIASADTARSMGIDWWTTDPFLSSDARRAQDEVEQLRRRVAELEQGRGDDHDRD